MDFDILFGKWLNDCPYFYFQGETFDTSGRIYVLHPNSRCLKIFSNYINLEKKQIYEIDNSPFNKKNYEKIDSLILPYLLNTSHNKNLFSLLCLNKVDDKDKIWCYNYFLCVSIENINEIYNRPHYFLRINGKNFSDCINEQIDSSTKNNFFEKYINYFLFTPIFLNKIANINFNNVNSSLPISYYKFNNIRNIIFSLQLTNKEFGLIEKKNFMKYDIKREYKNYVSYLPLDFPQIKYNKNLEAPQNYHWGQRKLLLGEIEFLTFLHKKLNIEEKSDYYLVLYAGAAPGDHIPILKELFPKCIFILYDPSNFHISPDNRIFIKNDLVTKDIIEKYKSDKLIFISDIRSTPNIDKKSKNYDNEFEKCVDYDIKLQKEWVEFLKEKIQGCILKFRFPFFNQKENNILGNTYFSGKKYFQPWSRPTSAETRLICLEKDDFNIIEQNPQKYEEQMFYFNIKYRSSTFYDINKLYGKNYDFITEYFILKDYLLLYYKENEITDIFIAQFTKNIDSYLNSISISYGFKSKKGILDLLLE